MKSRPILFIDEMVRATRDGRKTQTRRPVTLREFQPSRTRGCDFTFRRRDGVWEDVSLQDMLNPPRSNYPGQCPYGVPGDELWVREASAWCDAAVPPTRYRADTGGTARDAFAGHECVCLPAQRWTPSIHMPRSASRTTLRVTGVRIERVQDITEADAIAEGARRFDDIPAVRPTADARWSMGEPKDTGDCLGTARFAFGNVWDRVYARRGLGWSANPWVWVVSFERIAAPAPYAEMDR